MGATPPVLQTILRGTSRPAAAVLAGACLWLAFPTYDLWFLAPVGVGVLALAVRGCSLRRGFLLGWLAGITFFLCLLSWTAIFVGLVALVPLALVEALFPALFGLLAVLAQRPAAGLPQPALDAVGLRTGAAARAAGPLRAVLLGAAWTLTESLRARLPFGGFPWGRLVFSQADSPALGVAPLVGAPGVTFVVATAGAALALAALGLTRPAPGRWRRAVPGAVAAVLLMTLPAGVPRPVDAQAGTIDVAMVQGNVPEVRLEFNAQRRAVLDLHLRRTHELADDIRAGRRPRPDVVLWPENASDIDPLRNADVVRLIGAQVADLDTPLVVGAVLREPHPRVSNTVLVYAPDRGVVDRYSKQRPVPFAEYVPYRAFFRSITAAVDNVRADFAPGGRPGLIRLPTQQGPVPTAVGICFEVADDAIVREGVELGGQVIYIPTNNATFGFTDESEQQLAISRVRAVEHGRAVMHISNVGVSGFVLPDGTVEQRTALYQPATPQMRLPRRTTLTPADRLGPWPEAALAGGTALWAALAWGGAVVARVRRRAHHPGGTP